MDPESGQKAAHAAPLKILSQIVSRGHVLLKDLMLTCKTLPAPLTHKEVLGGKFAPVLFDYSYFKNKASLEQKFEDQAGLRQLDDELQRVYSGTLENLFDLLRGIVELHASILSFLSELQAGRFLQCCLQTLLQSTEGKQLFCETIALLGCILLTLDQRLPGPVRERLIVAFYRLKGGLQAAGPTAETVIALCADTGLNLEKGRTPACYPEAYFSRMKLPGSVIIRAIHTIRGDDIYRQTPHFPLPEHRTAALASQASQLYLLLWFSPDTLHNDGQLMRTLVDRHFSDNWVVAWGHGCIADLAVEWEPFYAARSALSGLVSVSRARDLSAAISLSLPDTMTQLAAHTSKTHISEEYVLEHIPEILATLRQGNVSLRWILLHSCSRQRRLKAAVKSVLPAESEQLKLVLQIAELEHQVKHLYGKLLASRHERWQGQQAALKAQISSLQAFLTAMQTASGTDKQIDFSLWFQQVCQQVDEMRLQDPSESSRRVQEVVAKLDELERFYGGEAQLQTSQYLALIRTHLGHLMRLSDVTPDVLHALAAISDFSYGWGPMSSLVSSFQTQIRQRPEVVAEMLSLFRKVESMLEAPKSRLREAQSDGLQSTLVFYSAAIQEFAKSVLQVVPGLLWGLVDGIVSSGRDIDNTGSRIEVSSLREVAMLEQRASIAEQTSKVARLATGIRKLDRCRVGVLQLESQQLVVEGIKQLLSMRIAGSAATLLVFPQRSAPIVMPNPFQGKASSFAAAFSLTKEGFSGEQAGRTDLTSRLTDLGQRLGHLQTCMECLGDLLRMVGATLWGQQLAAVSSWNLQKDSMHMVSLARLARRNVGRLPARTPMTFMGRIMGELIRLTHYDRTRYSPLLGNWRDATGHIICAQSTVKLLSSTLGPACIIGMQQLLKLRIAFILDDIFFDLQSLDSASEEGTQLLKQASSSRSWTPGISEFQDAERKCKTVLQSLQAAALAIGQAQLLLSHLSQQLQEQSRYGGALIFAGVGSVNDAVIAEDQFTKSSRPQTDSAFLQFRSLSEQCGFEEPSQQKYRSKTVPGRLPELIFLLLIYTARQLQVSRKSGGLEFEAHCSLDPVPFAAGLACVMLHLEPQGIQVILELVGLWTRSFVQASTGTVALGIEAAGVQISLPSHVACVLALLQELSTAGILQDKAISESIPYMYDCRSSITFGQ